MNRRPTLIALAALLAALPVATAMAANSERAAQSFSQGNTLLATGDFSKALEAFATAAKQDTDNQEYREQYAVLRRVIKIRKSLDTEKNPQKWETSAAALRAFYYAHELYGEALVLDRQAHAKLNTPDSAALLGETLINLGDNAEAVVVLQSVEPEKATLQTRVLTGIAFSHAGKLEEARGIAKDVAQPENAGPGMLFDVARLQALVGNKDAALGLLAQCFESTPPSRLDAFKTYAKEHADLASLASNAEFTKVLQTESKVKESGCSGGSNCGSCPSRGKSCGTSSTGSCTSKKE